MIRLGVDFVVDRGRVQQGDASPAGRQGYGAGRGRVRARGILGVDGGIDLAAVVQGDGIAIREVKAMGPDLAIGPKVLRGLQFGGKQENLINRLAHEADGSILKAVNSIPGAVRRLIRVTQLTPTMDKKITEEMAAGFAKQETLDQIRERVLNISGLVDDENRIILLNGRSYDADDYADLVARTRSREAMTDAKALRYQDTGVEYYRVSQHTNPCPVCLAFQGKVWAFSESNDLGFPVIPADYGLCPWHPRCLHVISAWSPAMYSDEEIQEFLDAHDDDASLLAAAA